MGTEKRRLSSSLWFLSKRLHCTWPLFVYLTIFTGSCFALLSQASSDADIDSHKIQLVRHSLPSDDNSGALGGDFLRDWNAGGSTVATPQRVVLIPNFQGKKGWLWNTLPIPTDTFEVEFALDFTANDDNTDYKVSQGMAFWYAPSLPPVQNMSHVAPSDATFFSNSPLFSGLGVFFAPSNSQSQRKASISCAIASGTQSFNVEQHVPTPNGVTWDVLHPGIPLYVSISVAPQWVEAKARVGQSMSWQTLFQVNGTLDFRGYIGFTADSGAANDATSGPANGIAVRNIKVWNLNPSFESRFLNDNTAASDPHSHPHDANSHADFNHQYTEHAGFMQEVLTLTNIVETLGAEMRTAHQHIKQDISAVHQRLSILNKEISKILDELHLQQETQTPDVQHSFVQSVSHELAGLKRMFHSHAERQDKVAQQLVQAKQYAESPAAGEHIETIKATLQDQVKMGWFMCGFIMITVLIVLITVWKKARDIEKKHLL